MRSDAKACLAIAWVVLLGACSGSASPDAVVAQAERLIAEGKASEAQVRLKAMLGKHAGIAPAHLLLARIALESGDFKTADAELSRLTPAQRQEPAAQVLRWRADLGLGRHEQVLAELPQAPAGIDRSDLTLIEAEALRAARRPADALEVLRAAGPGDARIVVALAQTLTELGYLEQAIIELDRFLDAAPRQHDALAARGALLMRAGAGARAAGDLRGALEAAPADWSPLARINTRMLLGETGLASGNASLAREQLAAMEKESPGTLGSRLLAASIALYEGRAGDAADSLQVVARALPGNARVHYMLADAWLRDGNQARAIDLLERRLREAPRDVTARRMLARLLRSSRPDRVVELLGDLPREEIDADLGSDNLLSSARIAQAQATEALEVLQEKASQRPDDRELLLELAAAFLRNGQPTRALSTLDKMGATVTSPAAAALEMSASIASGNEAEANRLVAMLIKTPSASIDTLLAVSDAAQAAGRRDAALRLIEESLRRDAAHAGALLRRANVEYLERDYAAAEKSLRTLIEASPQDVQARAALARVVESSGDTETATRELQTAVDGSPGTPGPALMLAAMHLRNSRLDDASRVFDRLIAAASADGAAANAAGQMLLRAGRPAEARARFGKAVEQAPGQAAYWFNLASSQAMAADRDAAIQSLGRAVSLRPDWAEAHTALIQIQLEAQRFAQAADLSRTFISRSPSDPQAWLMAGLVAMAESRPADAVSAFARSYSLRPRAISAIREYQARLAAKTLRPAQPLINWLIQEPADTEVRRMLAQHYLRAGAASDMIVQLEKLLEVAPNDAVALNNLAWALLRSDPKRSELLARRAHAIAPQQPAFADTLGSALHANGKYADAARVLGIALQAMPEDASVRTRFALALARSGDTSGARREVMIALDRGGEFEERKTAEKLLKELGT